MREARNIAALLLCLFIIITLFACAYKGYFPLPAEPTIAATTQRLLLMAEDLPMPMAQVEYTEWIFAAVPQPPETSLAVPPPQTLQTGQQIQTNLTAAAAQPTSPTAGGGARYYAGISLPPPTIAELYAFLDAHPQTYGVSYTKGTLSQATREGALNHLNSIRFIAGAPANITWDAAREDMAEAAAVIMFANEEVSHHPKRPADVSDELFRLGYEGCESANLAAVGTKRNALNTALRLFLGDSDEANLAELAHRRWMLNPGLGKTAFGVLDQYVAMTVLEHSNAQAGPQHSIVMYPGQVTPVSYFDDDWAWTVSFSEDYNVRSASAAIVRRGDGKYWRFNYAGTGGRKTTDGDFSISTEGYGQPGCVIFRPRGISIQAGDVYDVQIAGVTKGGQDWLVQYTVQFIAAASQGN